MIALEAALAKVDCMNRAEMAFGRWVRLRAAAGGKVFYRCPNSPVHPHRQPLAISRGYPLSRRSIMRWIVESAMYIADGIC